LSYIDIRFPIRGREIPLDYAYYLYAAISSQLPQLHGKASTRSLYWDNVRIHPIDAAPVSDKKRAISRNSYIALRCHQKIADELLELKGQKLKLGPNKVLLGKPAIIDLQPYPTLYSQMVVISGVTEYPEFVETLPRLLAELNLDYRIILGTADQVRHLKIANSDVCGYPVSITDLNDQDSLNLQSNGIGGRGSFGCGVFVPGDY
jgi:CRISPR-associated protein Cas6